MPIEDGCKKYPRQAELDTLLNDLKKEYMGIAVVRRSLTSPRFE